VIQKVLIDNRGEIARRIFNTCQRLGVGAVVAYSSLDAHSLAVREARTAGRDDERYGAVLIGGNAANVSYEDVDGVIAAAKALGCDAVHPGYGFLSERADAARAITATGLIYIGPNADVIQQVGNKSSARELAERCGVPCMPASHLIHRYSEVEEQVETIGYPFVLKADVGGGGMNNLFVEDETELAATFENFSLRNPSGFYVEKKLTHARHIELQLAADTHGNVVVLGERDCTAQRKAQKVIEEAPVTIAPEDVLQRVRDSAISMAKKAGYTGIGTWEFLFDPATNDFYFMEINPRIQVEHTVTEMQYDSLDLVAWQLAIANGESLPEVPKKRSVHVMQLRLYAEDPQQDFRLSPGEISLLQFPDTNSQLRIDKGYEQGDTLPAGLDATIAKLIVTAPSREEARRYALKVLNETLISGVSTNRDFLRWLLQTPEFTNDSHWTTFIEPAWHAHQKSRWYDVQQFFETSTFVEERTPFHFEADTYLQDLQYQRRGVERRYSRDLAAQQAAHRCGFRYGILTEPDGRRLAVGYWDFGVMGGTLGSEEGAAVVALFKLANQHHLPVAIITASSGARQQEGAKALEMMDVMVAARWCYRPPLYVNVYSGANFGGVTVSLAESADISMAVSGSKIGFAGPDLVARMMGKATGTDLPLGAHSAENAYAHRTLDLIVENLPEAHQRILSLTAQLTGETSLSHPYTHWQTDIPTNRYDRPGSERFITQVAELAEHTLSSAPLPNTVDTIIATRTLLNDPARPTAADFLNPTNGVFDTVSPLASRQVKQASEEYPPIVGAIATIGSRTVMVLGQQTQRRLQPDGTLQKVYVAPRARDFQWALRKIAYAQQQGLPIILMSDTTGGDASLVEEANGVSRAIADLLGIFYEPDRITVPVISLTIGENGSGGALTFARPLDASADLEYALTFVATPDAQVKILTDTWPDDDDHIAKIINQLQDATSSGRRQLHHIDEIIKEPEGGAQTDPASVGHAMRRFIEQQLDKLTTLTPQELLERRFERVNKAGEYGLRPNEGARS